jgi:hypothetical protein
MMVSVLHSFTSCRRELLSPVKQTFEIHVDSLDLFKYGRDSMPVEKYKDRLIVSRPIHHLFDAWIPFATVTCRDAGGMHTEEIRDLPKTKQHSKAVADGFIAAREWIDKNASSPQ